MRIRGYHDTKIEGFGKYKTSQISIIFVSVQKLNKLVYKFEILYYFRDFSLVKKLPKTIFWCVVLLIVFSLNLSNLLTK